MLSTPRREGSAVGTGSGGGSSSSMGSASTKYFLLIFGYVLSFFRAEKGARGLLRILYIADGAKTAKARRKNPSASVGAARGATEYEGKMCIRDSRIVVVEARVINIIREERMAGGGGDDRLGLCRLCAVVDECDVIEEQLYAELAGVGLRILADRLSERIVELETVCVAASLIGGKQAVHRLAEVLSVLGVGAVSYTHLYSDAFYTSDCMLKRNRYMVGRADACVAYCLRNSGGTAYTLSLIHI